ncbi:MAG TPA: WXG100 family type VII secretion target [Herpetosiphonaceae bacterium]
MAAPVVQAQYEQLQELARRFTQSADVCEGMLQGVRGAKEVLQKGSWVGDASVAFVQEMDGLVLPGVQRLIEALQASSAASQQIAAIIEQAEEEAAALFQNWAIAGLAAGAAAGAAVGAGGAAGAAGAAAGAKNKTDVDAAPAAPVIPPPLGLPARPAAPPQPTSGDGSGAYDSDSPGVRDYLNRELFYKVADSADALGLDNAARNMRHYLNNTGAEQSVSPEQMLTDLPGFREKANSTYQTEIVDVVNQRIASEYNGQPMRFQITSPWQGYYATKGESQDWFYAIGGYSYAHGAEVLVTPGPDGKPQVQISHQMHVFDRYNWDKGKGVDIGPIRVGDAQLGRLHEAGLAREYEVWGASQPQTDTYQYTGPTNSPPYTPGESPDTRRDSTRRDPDGERRWGRGDGR